MPTQRRSLRLADERISIQMLTPDGHHAMMPVINVYDEGGGMADSTRHDGEEFVHVLEGSVELTVGNGEPIVLEAGRQRLLPLGRAALVSERRRRRGAVLRRHHSAQPVARSRTTTQPQVDVGAAGSAPRVRGEFPIFETATYLNSCSQGALSHRVRVAVEGWLAGWDANGAEWEFWVERNEAFRAAFAGLAPRATPTTSP